MVLIKLCALPVSKEVWSFIQESGYVVNRFRMYLNLGVLVIIVIKIGTSNFQMLHYILQKVDFNYHSHIRNLQYILFGFAHFDHNMLFGKIVLKISSLDSILCKPFF